MELDLGAAVMALRLAHLLRNTLRERTLWLACLKQDLTTISR
jgi:hypothetical protein